MTDEEYWNILCAKSAELFSQGTSRVNIWRRFLCDCYRNVEKLIPPTLASHQWIELAEQYIAGTVCYDDLVRAYKEVLKATDEAWKAVFSLRLQSPDFSDSFVWPLSDEVDAAKIRYLAFEAAASALHPDLRQPLIVPDAAACIRPWALARPNLKKQGIDADSEAARELVIQEFDRLYALELESQIRILLRLMRGEKGLED